MSGPKCTAGVAKIPTGPVRFGSDVDLSSLLGAWWPNCSWLSSSFAVSFACCWALLVSLPNAASLVESVIWTDVWLAVAASRALDCCWCWRRWRRRCARVRHIIRILLVIVPWCRPAARSRLAAGWHPRVSRMSSRSCACLPIRSANPLALARLVGVSIVKAMPVVLATWAAPLN